MHAAVATSCGTLSRVYCLSIDHQRVTSPLMEKLRSKKGVLRRSLRDCQFSIKLSWYTCFVEFFQVFLKNLFVARTIRPTLSREVRHAHLLVMLLPLAYLDAIAMDI